MLPDAPSPDKHQAGSSSGLSRRAGARTRLGQHDRAHALPPRTTCTSLPASAAHRWRVTRCGRCTSTCTAAAGTFGAAACSLALPVVQTRGARLSVACHWPCNDGAVTCHAHSVSDRISCSAAVPKATHPMPCLRVPVCRPAQGVAQQTQTPSLLLALLLAGWRRRRPGSMLAQQLLGGHRGACQPPAPAGALPQSWSTVRGCLVTALARPELL